MVAPISYYRIAMSMIRCNFLQILKNSTEGVQSHLKFSKLNPLYRIFLNFAKSIILRICCIGISRELLSNLGMINTHGMVQSNPPFWILPPASDRHIIVKDPVKTLSLFQLSKFEMYFASGVKS